jgi:hypothetical protein
MDQATQYDQARALKHIAEVQIDQSTRDITTILEQHGADYRWITASLLLLNSGGAVAALNTEYIGIHGKIQSGIAFVVGIIFALSVAWLSQILTPRIIGPMAMYRSYWIKIYNGFEYDEADELREVEKVRKERRKIAWPVPTAGWLSIISFLTAMVIISQNIVPKESAGLNISRKMSPTSQIQSR